LRDHGVTVRRGGSFDRWDLEVRGGLLGGARLSMVNEEHGRGQQLLRFRCWPRWSVWILLPLGITLPLSIAAALDHAWLDLAVLGILAFMALERAFRSAMMALATLVSALRRAETTMPSLHRVEGGKPSRSPITASQLQGERASNE
jgi:hypothetical protein